MPNDTQQNLDQARSRLRHWRANLSTRQQKAAALAMTEQLCRHPAFINSHLIGAYLAEDGEIDPQYIIDCAWKLGKKIYLPVMSDRRDYHLDFYEHHKKSKLLINKFSIREPIANTKPIMPWQLDLVLLPLVAFDNNCNRIGRGAGFYDRCFAFVNELPKQPRPNLVGLAHPEQKISDLKPEIWDVAMDFIVTSDGVLTHKT